MSRTAGEQCRSPATCSSLNADGTYDAVIAASNPGLPNWIDTGGLTQGVFASRFLLTEEKPLPEASVVKLADLPALVYSAVTTVSGVK